MVTEQELEKTVVQALGDPTLFVVEIAIGTPPQPKISIILDGEQGITIDQCAQISKKVAAVLEENDAIDSAYRLEVSSPGVDQPLRTPRQYAKHVGRDIKITKKDATTVEGKFTGFDKESIMLEHFKEVHKGKFKSTGTSSIPLGEMDYLQIKVKF